MSSPNSSPPGRHERHLRRRWGNPLFPQDGLDDLPRALELARQRDRQEHSDFLADLRDTVQRAVELKPQEESQVVLDLKADLDRLYETASGLGGDQSGNKAALLKLLVVIMRSVWAGAAGDPQAEAELEQEERARTIHFELLEYPLVADLLDPEEVIGADELVPSLLSEEPAGLEAALGLFDAPQLLQLCRQAEELLTALDPQRQGRPAAWERLGQMRTRLAALSADQGRH